MILGYVHINKRKGATGTLAGGSNGGGKKKIENGNNAGRRCGSNHVNLEKYK